MAALAHRSALALVIGCVSLTAAEPPVSSRFHREIQPLLEQYCWDCHGDGMDKGNVTFDGFKSEKEALEKRELWLAVLKNVRAGIMPPAKKPRVSPADLKKLESWIKQEAFGIDFKNSDPGRVTIRRLNRVEYRNTIRDLMGIDFKADDEFPPDDTGYGFDNIGDVLTVSPLLLEKYMQAAETIVAAAVPTNALVLPEKTFAGSQFRDGDTKGESLDIYKPATLTQTFKASADGDYRVLIDVTVSGHFDFDPGRCTLTFAVDGQERLSKDLGWEAGKKFNFDLPDKWKAGEHELTFELKPLTPPDQKKTYINLRIDSVRVQGPLDKKHWTRPKNFDRFFTKDDPKKPAERRKYAQQILSKFAAKAYRRPVDQRTVDRLVSIAEGTYRSGKTFEEAIGRAFTAVLASPRFLFRVEEVENSTAKERYPLVDEFSLASRLSYFLWSTTPDDELLQLAQRGELRKNLGAQVKRMLADRKADELVQNFTGQWLQTRDVEGIDINARVILFRDNPGDPDFRRKRERREELREKRDKSKLTPEEERELDQLQEEFFRRFRNRPNIELDGELRRAMRRETELAFGHIMREDRSVLELLDADYTFLNERLARHYALTNLDITGPEMRRVTLPDESPRGGVLAHGSMLIVTSNPTRTSPVKRGLFVLENILGTPPPPPPADVPDLEEAAKEFKDREPTLREMLELHASKALCSSCHSRMDPIGLALENFNALGMWRDTERRQPIDTKGKLITGESFNGLNELKRILVNERRLDYYRCLTEKLLTYALGRGLEDYDVHTIDQIVERMEADKGRFSALLMGVIESSPFQKRRNSAVLAGQQP